MEDLPNDNNFFISLPYFGLQSELCFFFFFEGLYSQKINTLETSKLKTRKIKSLMEEEIPSGTK